MGIKLTLIYVRFEWQRSVGIKKWGGAERTNLDGFERRTTPHSNFHSNFQSTRTV